jgi:hypothetical protein
MNNPNNIILLIPKDQYGKMTYLPANPAAMTFADIAGTVTLTPQTIKRILSLGFEVTYV